MTTKSFLATLTLLAVVAAAQGKDLLRDDFTKENPEIWEQLPAGADFSKGHLQLPTSSGGASLVSIDQFENAQATIVFSISKTGTEDSVFYYLGFQSVQPWMRDAFYAMIQDTALVICVRRAGEEETVQFTVPDVSMVAGRDYELTLRWAASQLEVLLDGRRIYSVEDPEIMPVGPLHLFLAVNTLEKDGEPEVLSLKSAVVESL